MTIRTSEGLTSVLQGLSNPAIVAELQSTLLSGSPDGIFGPDTGTALGHALLQNRLLPQWSINEDGIALVANYEGFRDKAYRCPAGVWTIGYGHTQNVRPEDTMSEATARSVLKVDLAYFDSRVAQAVRVPIGRNMHSALCSFTFNLGEGSLGRSTLLKLVNQRKFSAAADEFSKWVKAGGRVMPGLVRRRQEERSLFLRDVV